VNASARRRVLFAIASNGFVSVTSLLLAVAIARRSDGWEFGQFSIAMAIYLFAIGLIRAAITETTLAVEPTSAANGRGFRRAALVSLVSALALLAIGLLAHNVYLIVLAVTLNGLVCLDYLRTVEAALYRARTSLVQGTIWSAVTAAASITSIVVPIDPLLVFGIWAGSGAVIGYASALWARLSLVPWWSRHAEETRAAWLFSLDYAAGSGGSALSTAVLGVTSSTTTVGALRGAGTILGPVSLLSTTVRSLIIPYLTRARAIGGRYEFRRAAAIAGGLAVVLAIPAALLCLLSARIGTALLGSTWDAAAPLLPALAIESVLALVGNIASAGHRSRRAGTRSLALRLSVGIPRPFIVIAAAAAMGALGAAWAMAALAVVNCVIWWASYWQLSRAPAPEPVPAS
jgi:O-antigen/teichoic acid export membrane protein